MPQPPTHLPTEPSDAEAAARLRRQVDILDRLADVGMEIVEALAADIKAAKPGSRARTSLVHAFDRAARAVRLAVTLQAALLHHPEAFLRQGAGAAQSAQALGRIGREADRGDALDRIRPESPLSDRPDRDDFGDLTARPVDETITFICGELGVSPEAIEAGVPRHVFARRDDPPPPEQALYAFPPPGNPAHRAQAPP